MKNDVVIFDIDYNAIFYNSFNASDVDQSLMSPVYNFFSGNEGAQLSRGHIYGASSSGKVLFNALPDSSKICSFVDLSPGKTSWCERNVQHPRKIEWADFIIIGTSPSNYLSVLKTLHPIIPENTLLIFPWSSHFFNIKGWMLFAEEQSQEFYDSTISARHDKDGKGDRRGKLIAKDDGVSRVLYEQEFSFYFKLLRDVELMREMHEHGLVGVELPSNFGVKNPYVFHPVLPPQNSMYWTFSQFKDAFLFFTDFWTYLIDKNFSLQDCHTDNIMFHKSRPVFVDLCSIGPIEATTVSFPFIDELILSWIAPLALIKARELVLFSEHSNGHTGWNIFKAILPERTFAEVLNLRERAVGHAQQGNITRMLSMLKEWAEKIDIVHTEGGWNSEGYQKEELDVAEESLDLKTSILKSIIDKYHPYSYLDLGCNKGKHSVMSSRMGVYTMSLDTADSILDKLYIFSKKNNLPLDSFKMPVNKILGFNNPRFTFDIVSYFALIHHLYFSAGMTMRQICEQASCLCNNIVLMEYISPCSAEPFVLNNYSPKLHADYSLAAIEALLREFFSQITLTKLSESRSLFIAIR